MNTQLIEIVITFISGGGLMTLLTMKWVRKSAEANAMKEVQDVYQETIKDLRDDKKELGIEIQQLKDTTASNTKEIEALKRLKCYDIACPVRKKQQ